MRAGGAASRRPSGISRRARSGTPARCSRRSSPSRRPGACARTRSPGWAGCARTRKASERAPTSSSPRSPSRPTTSGCASKSSQGLSWCLHSSRSVPPRWSTRRRRSGSQELGDTTVLAGVLALVAFLESAGGEGVATARIERALALEYSPPWTQVLGRPDWIHGLLLVWSGGSTRRTIGTRPCCARRSRAATSIRCRSCSSRSAARAADGRLAAGDASRARVPRGERAQRPGRRTTLRDHDRSAAGRPPRGGGLGAGTASTRASSSQSGSASIRRASSCSRRSGFLELSLGDAAAAERALDRVAE